MGEKGLDNLLKEYLIKNNVSIEKAEKDLENNVAGFIDPLDDNLEFYGNDKFKELIVNNFSDR